MPASHLPILTVLGGSSVSTPALVAAIGRAVHRRELCVQLRLRLWGRNQQRLDAVAAHSRRILAELAASATAATAPGTGTASFPWPYIETCATLEAALEGPQWILCQVRPGGFRGRAADERFALAHGIPGDEGLGPSGLACFLRCRPVMDSLHTAIARLAPGATLLQMTSPLGLTVARAREQFGLRAFGVCELPALTAARVRTWAEPRLGHGPLQIFYAGLNHQCWLHSIRDTRSDREHIDELLAIWDERSITRLDPATVRHLGAIPVHYLRLYYATEEFLSEAREQTETRGEHLDRWADQLDHAYRAQDHARIEQLLASRDLGWYEHGIAPAIVAFTGSSPRRIPLTLPGGGAFPGVPPTAFVELPAMVSRDRVEPLPVPHLPPIPQQLTQALIRWERTVLDLPDTPNTTQLTTAFALHPLVPDDARAATLAKSWLQRNPLPLGP
jgi:6-phospho-beta-glucosidase